MNQISIQSKRFALLVAAAIVLAACGGSSENSSSASSAVTRTKNNALPTEATTTVVLPCATGGACAVGDTGPGGGKVFYVASSSFTSPGSACAAACMYLEAAPTGWITAATPAGQVNCATLGTATLDPKCAWSGSTNTGSLIGTTGTGIGAGYANTSAMLAQSGTAGKAGTVARAFQGGGKTDWFLPSKDELNQLYINKGISGIDSGKYWSSTERNAQIFGTGVQSSADNKEDEYYVRPARAFSETTTPTTIAPITTTTITASTATVVASCATGGVCAVGDTGPGGGKVFYVASSSFTSTGSACGAKCMYLEAAPTGWITAATPVGQANCRYLGTSTVDPECGWLANQNQLIGTTGEGIGKGYANTSAMIAQAASAGVAGTVARAFKGGGKTDWHLPSKDELNQMYLKKTTIGGFGKTRVVVGLTEVSYNNYWSSSEDQAETARIQNFSDGSKTSNNKDVVALVRPVRAFSGTTAQGLAAVVTATTIAPTTTSTAIALSTSVLTCATGGVCAVGDIGPGGGKVFYVASSSFTSTGSACGTTCMYLEAAPTGWITAATPAGQVNCSNFGTVDPQCEWSGNTSSLIGTTVTAIGTGYANTSQMIANSSTAGKAGTVARAFQGGGKTDWYLPSKDELNQMYVNKTAIGISSSGSYWSSSERNAQSFASGVQVSTGTQNEFNVRPVRAFAPAAVFASCATGGVCAVGDTGPGGGKVFYASSSSFTSTGSACGTKCMYLEAAPTGWITAATPVGQVNCPTLGTSSRDPQCEWASFTFPIGDYSGIGATGEGIGTGYANTSKIVAKSTAGEAGTVARAFKGGGKTDWYLPSSDELSQMYVNREIIGIGSGRYWGSSERTSYERGVSGYVQDFTYSNRGYDSQVEKLSVRPVRAFASCVKSEVCAVGDTGPGGGKVFYAASSSFTSTGSACGTKCMYLEAAPTGWITAATPVVGQVNCATLGTSTLDPKCEWSDNAAVVIAPVGILIGTGYANTSAMIAQSGTKGKAGTIARAFQVFGKTDWYLPSRDELYEMYFNKGIIGINSGKYWSSTQAGNSALLQDFSNGVKGVSLKITAGYVRPVRAF